MWRRTGVYQLVWGTLGGLEADRRQIGYQMLSNLLNPCFYQVEYISRSLWLKEIRHITAVSSAMHQIRLGNPCTGH